MAKRQRLTNNSDETEIAGLLSGDTVFAVPYFQRAYKWKPERLKQLNEDLLSLVDGRTDYHFLGAVIIHGRRSNPSDPDVYDVIDGQQRITTLFLYLSAAVKILCELGEYVEAAGLFQRYLVIPRETQLMSNLKLHSCKDDRAQLNAVFEELFQDKAFVERIAPFKLRPLPATGVVTGVLRNNFRSAVRFFREEREQGGLDRVQAIVRVMLEQISVVQIDVWDPTNGPKIFDALNSRQEPMTIGDLVRNEIFSRVADEHPDAIELIDQNAWQPFYKKFQQGSKNLFDGYFFPYGLTRNANLRKSEVYGWLREAWRKIDDPEAIIAELRDRQNAYLDLVCGTNFQGLSSNLEQAFRRLFDSGAPAATYPFFMQLSNACRDNRVPEGDALATLAIVESFLVRRAICGHEPTGLHAVFKRLWADCGEQPTADALTVEIKKHKTVVWPSEAQVKEAILSRPLYGAAITPFVILEYDRSLGGDAPGIVPWIEHVLPENPADEWFDAFAKEQHESMKDLLANLIPLSHQMNIGVSNKPYTVKRPIYAEDSAFKSARRFAEENEKWTPKAVESRGTLLAGWAITRWRY